MCSQFGKDGILWGGSHIGAGAESDHKGAAHMSYGLTTAPIACSPVCLERGDAEESEAWWF